MDATVLAAQMGSPEAFSALYEAHKPRVMSLCLKITGDREKAEDLTQDTFLRLHRKIHTFKGTSQFTTWLHRMTVNIVRMDYRKDHSKARLAITLVPLVFGEDEDAYDVPEPRTADPVLRLDLVKAISSLDQPYREALINHHIRGLEQKRGSKIRTYRARVKMRAYLTTKEKA